VQLFDPLLAGSSGVSSSSSSSFQRRFVEGISLFITFPPTGSGTLALLPPSDTPDAFLIPESHTNADFQITYRKSTAIE
jgi:hypothetical protein